MNLGHIETHKANQYNKRGSTTRNYTLGSKETDEYMTPNSLEASVQDPKYLINNKGRIKSLGRRLLALQVILVNGESFLQEVLLLLEVDGLETSGDGSAASATSVQDMAAVVVLGSVQQAFNTGLGIGPGTGVEGLLLAPDDILSVGVAVQVLLQLSPREGGAAAQYG